jgi:tetratricopeptide (TPR) repeat protein
VLDADVVQSFAARGEFDQAYQMLSSHLQVAPNDPLARFLRAQLALERSDGPSDRFPREWAEQALSDLEHVRGSRTDPALVWLYRGKALHHLSRFGAAESAWLRAIDFDPSVPEAGWGLLELYYVENRRSEATALALRLYRTEPNPQDRLNLLLELIRQDAVRPNAQSVAALLEPIGREEPNAVAGQVARGLALVRSSAINPGLELLRSLVERLPDDAEAWRGLLEAVDEAGQADTANTLERVWESVPTVIQHDPSLSRARARLAQRREDWPMAASEYLDAWKQEPEDLELAYLLAQAIRRVGHKSYAAWAQRVADARTALAESRRLHEELGAAMASRDRVDAARERRAAQERERCLRFEEAIVWYQRVLELEPDDSVARAGIERLQRWNQTVSLDSPP